MNKPTMKTEIAVDKYSTEFHSIFFYATPDAAREMESFGRVKLWPCYPDYYHLVVDGRYDFSAVLEYINNYESAGVG